MAGFSVGVVPEGAADSMDAVSPSSAAAVEGSALEFGVAVFFLAFMIAVVLGSMCFQMDLSVDGRVFWVVDRCAVDWFSLSFGVCQECAPGVTQGCRQ